MISMLWIIYLLSIARLAFWLCSTTNACVIVRDRSTYFGIRVGVIFTPFAAGYVDQVLAILVNLSMSLAINLHLTLFFIICLRPFLLCFSATRHFIPILLYLVSVSGTSMLWVYIICLSNYISVLLILVFVPSTLFP